MNRWLRIRMGAKRLVLRVLRSVRYHLGLERTTYVDQRVGQYRGYWAQAASALSAEFEALTESIWEVRRNGMRTRIANYVTEFDNPVTLHLAGDKKFLYGLAESTRTPVPEHVFVGADGVGEAGRLLSHVDGPCVVKPARDTSSGVGITTYVDSRSSLEWAMARASLWCPEILVERQVPGESYRLLFLQGNMIHAVRRRGTHVRGDGVHDVRKLAARAGVGPLDRMAHLSLSAQGLTADTVPPSGASVLVGGLPSGEHRTQELRTVYDEDVTDLVAPELVAEISPLLLRLGTAFAGVDVITVDPTRPLRETGGAFLEVNTTPGIHHHDVPGADGREFRVGEAVLEQLLSA